MPPDAPYRPPLTLTPALLTRVAEIAEALGRWSARQERTLSPLLRRENRIHTIHASLAIEQNSLSLEQVSAILDGKPVLGPARDIQEVRNAITAYEALQGWSPAEPSHLLEAHGLLMAGLIDRPGQFRSGGVGIYRGEQLVHMAPPAKRVPALVADLLGWLAGTDWHPLIAGCVVHYELEFIHPFPDGNGRLGRLWQTLILSRWNPLLAWLPIEEVIRARQEGYYDTLGQADQQGELGPFVAFMLAAILDALLEAIRQQPPAAAPGSEISSEIGSEILRLLAAEPTLSARLLGERLGISSRAVEKHLASLQRLGRLIRHGSPRAGRWEVR
ncbi:MAG: Fic family protein [Candidatus Sericytochromatia bacterium]|nr:Fic family protein [Candidatus Sericytochromatia bacterium]